MRIRDSGDDNSFPPLKKAVGLEPIAPDSVFNENILTAMFNENLQQIKCKFLIVVSMYNESAVDFNNTMIGINDNLAYFQNAGVNHEEILCIVIVDGLKSFLDAYQKQKKYFSQFFKDKLIKKRFKTKNILKCEIPMQAKHDEFAHCFTQKVCFGDNSLPLNFCLCIKQFNKRKLNTHLWFFGGFCKMIQPEYVMLIDVGTKPMPGSIFYLYEAMVCDPKLAGCCGEITPYNYSMWKIVIPAQVVEYKLIHMLDKAFESVIGFITVLPGAFSAYRWEALEGKPLWEDYFKSICHPEVMDAFQSNIYLAEDRVLCMSLVSKKGFDYKLRYVKKSVAVTDVPDSLIMLMIQRRRWINGSWFALINVLKKFPDIFKSSHNPFRKCLFTLQMAYYLLNVIYTWFFVGGFCLSLVLAVRRHAIVLDKDKDGTINIPEGRPYIKGLELLIILYISLIMMIFIISLGTKPQRVQDFFKFISVALGFYQFFVLYLVYVSLNEIESHNYNVFIACGLASVIGSYTIIIILNWEIVTIFKGVFHYLFLVPTYIHIFLIYSICNVHDCTWGNRPDTLSEEEKSRLDEFEEFRSRWTIVWALSNSGLAYFIGWLDESDKIYSLYFLAAVSGMAFAVLIPKTICGILYIFIEYFKKTLKVDRNLPKPDFNERPFIFNTIKSPEITSNEIPQKKHKENKVAPVNQDSTIIATNSNCTHIKNPKDKNSKRRNREESSGSKKKSKKKLRNIDEKIIKKFSNSKTMTNKEKDKKMLPPLHSKTHKCDSSKKPGNKIGESDENLEIKSFKAEGLNLSYNFNASPNKLIEGFDNNLEEEKHED
ncbi:hypothetical protein SteCoe_10702 [Stentor coeruleus]|uniref:chitin synthase n=1 Tax=Stentor coeruleus TaxID=5963 RepID=A0A1R2CES1_9CILI|nr:hypothetical protein SteCoe_10702 [Stentor coeruleus]